MNVALNPARGSAVDPTVDTLPEIEAVAPPPVAVDTVAPPVETPDVAPGVLPTVDYSAIPEVVIAEGHALENAPVLPSSSLILKAATTDAASGMGPSDKADLRHAVNRALGEAGETQLEALSDWVAGREAYPWGDDAATDALLAIADPLKLKRGFSDRERTDNFLRFERLVDDDRGFATAAAEAGIPPEAIEHIEAGPTESAKYDRYRRYQQTQHVLDGLAEVASDLLVEGTPAGEGSLAWSDNAVDRQVQFGENVGVLTEPVLADIAGAADALFATGDEVAPEALATAIALRVPPERLDEVEQMQIIGASNYVNLGEDVEARRDRAEKVIASFVTLDRAGRPPTLKSELERDLLSVHENLTGGHKHYDAIAPFVGVPGEHAQELGGGFEFELTNDANGEAQWGRHWKKKKGVFGTIASLALSVASFIPSPIAPIAQAASAVLGAVNAVKNGSLLGIVGAGLGAVTSLAGAVGQGISKAASTAIDFAKKGIGTVQAVVSGDPLAIAGAVAGFSDDPLAQRAGAGIGIVGAAKSGDPAGIVDAFLGAAKVERSLQTAPPPVVPPPPEAELRAVDADATVDPRFADGRVPLPPDAPVRPERPGDPRFSDGRVPMPHRPLRPLPPIGEVPLTPEIPVTPQPPGQLESLAESPRLWRELDLDTLPLLADIHLGPGTVSDVPLLSDLTAGLGGPGTLGVTLEALEGSEDFVGPLRPETPTLRNDPAGFFTVHGEAALAVVDSATQQIRAGRPLDEVLTQNFDSFVHDLLVHRDAVGPSQTLQAIGALAGSIDLGRAPSGVDPETHARLAIDHRDALTRDIDLARRNDPSVMSNDLLYSELERLTVASGVLEALDVSPVTGLEYFANGAGGTLFDDALHGLSIPAAVFTPMMAVATGTLNFGAESRLGELEAELRRRLDSGEIRLEDVPTLQDRYRPVVGAVVAGIGLAHLGVAGARRLATAFRSSAADIPIPASGRNGVAMSRVLNALEQLSPTERAFFDGLSNTDIHRLVSLAEGHEFGVNIVAELKNVARTNVIPNAPTIPTSVPAPASVIDLVADNSLSLRANNDTFTLHGLDTAVHAVLNGDFIENSVRLVSESGRSSVSGISLYRAMFDHFTAVRGASAVRGFRDTWAPVDGMSTNHRAFFENLARFQDPVRAASRTPDGVQYLLAGFRVDNVEILGDAVRVEFLPKGS
ncbi:MAG: hypothetical protein RIT81_32075 [Deltaproteobacteria bacterium]